MGSHNFRENKLKGISKTLGQKIGGLVGNGWVSFIALITGQSWGHKHHRPCVQNPAQLREVIIAAANCAFLTALGLDGTTLYGIIYAMNSCSPKTFLSSSLKGFLRRETTVSVSATRQLPPPMLSCPTSTWWVLSLSAYFREATQLTTQPPPNSNAGNTNISIKSIQNVARVFRVSNSWANPAPLLATWPSVWHMPQPLFRLDPNILLMIYPNMQDCDRVATCATRKPVSVTIMTLSRPSLSSVSSSSKGARPGSLLGTVISANIKRVIMREQHDTTGSAGPVCFSGDN